jgi:hypothetical protein
VISRIRADEPLQVLLFVCVPLLVLLGVVIVLMVRSSRTSSRFPTFSLSIERVGHEDAYLIYRDQDGHREFYLWPSGRKVAHLTAPKELPNEDIRKIVPNLALGLSKLGFQQYSLGKEGETGYIASGRLHGSDAHNS